MFEEICKHWDVLSVDSVEGFRVSINISTRDLMSEDLAGKLKTILETYNVPHTAFCLEITESAAMTDPGYAQDVLRALSKQGFKISIDDFGTGYASLAYLQNLPVDELKIDKSFVMGMEHSENDRKIVRSTVDLAHDIGLTVVAEGVENETSWKKLHELSCDEAQGFHMSRPIPINEFLSWRKAWPAQTRATLFD